MLPHHLVQSCPDQASTATVVLAASLGTDLSLWDAQLAPLAAHFHVVRYDARGHGGTVAGPGSFTLDDLADDVVELLDHLGLAAAHLVGLSLGGMTALRCATRHRERVRSLSVLAAAPQPGPAQQWLARAELVRSTGPQAVVDQTRSTWFSPAFAHRRPRRVHELLHRLANQDPEGYARCCEAMAGLDLRPELPRIDVPTLVLAGGDDPSATPARMRVIADAVPDAQLEVLPGVRHLMNVEDPHSVNDRLLEHLRRADR